MNSHEIVILIPAYNPSECLIDLTNRLIGENYIVVVVNDGSNDKSLEIFKKLNKNIIIINHAKNMGKGTALKTGFNYIKDNIECVGVITADADGQHLFEDIKKVTDSLIFNKESIILGCRNNMNSAPLRSKFGNFFTRKIFKLATGYEIFDTQTGLRGIPNKYLKDLVKINGDRYEYEINMLISFAIKKINIVEVNISTVYIDDNKASNFNAITDSYRIYKCIIFNTNLGTIILFLISACISFLIDYFVLINMVYFFGKYYNYDSAIFYSVIIARCISSIFNFMTNYFLVFKSKENLFISAFKYYSLALFVLCINYVLLDILAVKLNLDLKISKIVVEMFLFILNYIIEKVIFKKDLTSSVYGKK